MATAPCLPKLAKLTIPKPDPLLQPDAHAEPVQPLASALSLSPRARVHGGVPPLPDALASLSEELTAVFAAEKAVLGRPLDNKQPPESFERLDAAVRQAFNGYCTRQASSSADWRQYASFNQHHYVRHLLDANDDFELVLICWAAGQKSRVHNHSTSHCWLTCLDGPVQESRYTAGSRIHIPPVSPHGPHPMPVGGSFVQPCPELFLQETLNMQVGETGYVNDTMYLHSVGCIPPEGEPEPAAGQGAVTLHLYAPPIRRVKLYEPEDGRVVARTPGFFTIRGIPA